MKREIGFELSDGRYATFTFTYDDGKGYMILIDIEPTKEKQAYSTERRIGWEEPEAIEAFNKIVEKWSKK